MNIYPDVNCAIIHLITSNLYAIIPVLVVTFLPTLYREIHEPTMWRSLHIVYTSDYGIQDIKALDFMQCMKRWQETQAALIDILKFQMSSRLSIGYRTDL